MSGKNGPGEIIKAFSALFAFMALFGRFPIIVTFFDCVYGITKRTLTYFWPTQLTNGFIALYIIYQGLDIYLHQLQSKCNQLIARRISTIITVRNASQFLLFCYQISKDPKTRHEPLFFGKCFCLIQGVGKMWGTIQNALGCGE